MYFSVDLVKDCISNIKFKFGIEENKRNNRFDRNENEHKADSSPNKAKAIKTMSLGREIKKRQFREFPKPLTAEDTMNLIVESFLEGDEGY